VIDRHARYFTAKAVHQALDSIAVLDLGAVLIFRGRQLAEFPACLCLPEEDTSSWASAPVYSLTKVARTPFEQFALRRGSGSAVDCLRASGARAIDPDLARAWRQFICHLYLLAVDTPSILEYEGMREQYARVLMELLLRFAHDGSTNAEIGAVDTVSAGDCLVTCECNDIWIRAAI
jgi:hypothetical protein